MFRHVIQRMSNTRVLRVLSVMVSCAEVHDMRGPNPLRQTLLATSFNALPCETV
jgi:hypothetical protein